jgi:hypothetical protein
VGYASSGQFGNLEQQRTPVLRVTLDFQQQVPTLFVEIEQSQKPAPARQDAGTNNGRQPLERTVDGRRGRSGRRLGGVVADQ